MLLPLALLACAGSVEEAEPVDLVAYVNPFIGTGGAGFGYGGLSPAASAPGGLAKVGPDTRTESAAPGFSHSAGYHYDDTLVQAFSHARLPGIGVPDGGHIGFMPVDVETVDPTVYRRAFSHDDEVATPGFYSLIFPGFGTVELAATAHTAHHRYRWTADEHWLTIDLGHTGASGTSVRRSWLVVDRADREIRGYVLLDGDLTGRGDRGWPLYFVAEFSQPWIDAGQWVDGARVDATDSGPDDPTPVAGASVAATLRFQANVEVRVGLSVVDIPGARRNMAAELPAHWDLEATAAETEDLWADRMDRIEVFGGTETDRELFATALYHLFGIPTALSDVDGRFRGLDDRIDTAEGWTYYSDFSLWDTYRTMHPLVTLAWPEISADYARSLCDMGEKHGYLPRWPAAVTESGSMVGTPAEIVLGEAAAKGVDDWPMEACWDLALPRATDPEYAYAREGLADYQTYGYLPADLYGGSTGKTLEFAIADAALALWAEEMGQLQPAEQLRAQAQAYANVLNPETGFVQARNSDGTWGELEIDGWGDAFAEGNAWQYTFMVPHDAEGLAEAFGGRDVMRDALTELFELSLDHADGVDPGSAEAALPDPYYWHGNEPALASAFMFAEIGDPADAQRWATWVRGAKYDVTPSGLDGNDDGGTMSAWYAFNAMGLYPLNGTDRYVVTAPVFDEVRIRRPGGTLTIKTEGEGDYLAQISLDGEPIARTSLTHIQLSGPRTLRLERSDEPTTWGSW
ncbi:MAG: glycoside hydrolase family 92 protein [Alphaproteobacteria bacterium]|nr:glycoside hydrolase family 92 protein [Alphaproteobacteria bacterium]